MYKHAYKQKRKHENNVVDKKGLYSRASALARVLKDFLPEEPFAALDGYRQLQLLIDLQRKNPASPGFLPCSLRTYKQNYKHFYKHFAMRAAG